MNFSFFGLNWDTINGLLRNVLLALSSGWVGSGLITGEQQSLIIGGILAAVSVVLSWVSNARAAGAKAVEKAVEKSTIVDAKVSPTDPGKVAIVPAPGVSVVK